TFDGSPGTCVNAEKPPRLMPLPTAGGFVSCAIFTRAGVCGFPARAGGGEHTAADTTPTIATPNRTDVILRSGCLIIASSQVYVAILHSEPTCRQRRGYTPG